MPRYVWQYATTIFPVKLWTPEKIPGMLIFSWPFRCETKPQTQHWLVMTWQETTSWFFRLQESFNFTIFQILKFLFLDFGFVIPKNRYEGHFTEKRCWIKKTGSVDQTQLDSVSESEKKWANHKQYSSLFVSLAVQKVVLVGCDRWFSIRFFCSWKTFTRGANLYREFSQFALTLRLVR